MKRAAWIGPFIAAVLLALLFGGRSQRMSAIEVRARIAALGDHPEFQLVQTKQHKGHAVLGGGIEKKLRNPMRIRERVTPCVIEDYHFRGSAGSFCVQLLDREGERAVITIHGGPEASSASGKRLRTEIPNAAFGGLTIEANQNAEPAGTGQPDARSQSKSEGGDKPQPESQGRSR